MEQRKLIIILADISGYTRFMLENQTAALHGQLVISRLIEAILKHVDIPLTLQEIEGDAVFLYAAHPGADADWNAVVEQVSRKLGRFFHAFIDELAVSVESTPCDCAICRNADQLGLKIVVHAGEAVFHEIAGRPQVSGADVILAHRLLKNSVPGNEYLLLSEAAYAAMGPHLPGVFERYQESYDGFGAVPLRVRFLHDDSLAARDALYTLSDGDLAALVTGYTNAINPIAFVHCLIEQLRHPVRPFTLREKLLLIRDAIFGPIRMRLIEGAAIRERVVARGKRRTSWNGRPAALDGGPAPPN